MGWPGDPEYPAPLSNGDRPGDDPDHLLRLRLEAIDRDDDYILDGPDDIFVSEILRHRAPLTDEQRRRAEEIAKRYEDYLA